MRQPPVRRQISTHTTHTITVNDDTGLRRGLANCLRDIATWIDKRHSLAIEIHSHPVLSPLQQDQCIRQAIKALYGAVAAECREEAIEDLMRRTRPLLYSNQSTQEPR